MISSGDGYARLDDLEDFSKSSLPVWEEVHALQRPKRLACSDAAIRDFAVIESHGDEPCLVRRTHAKFFDGSCQFLVHGGSCSSGVASGETGDEEITLGNASADGIEPTLSREQLLAIDPDVNPMTLEIPC